MTLLVAALLALTPVTAEQARQAMPNVDLSDLNDQQRGTFLDAAAELFNYAGCQDTLALCLRQGKDPHALRMAALLKQMVKDNANASGAVGILELYYGSFAPKARQHVNAQGCTLQGTGPITIVEFSDYQCPHCAHAVQPLEELVNKDRKGQVKLCSKYFPFPSHPRARIAAACAEYARGKGKWVEMNSMLFEHQEMLEDADLRKYAQQLALNADEMLKEVYAGKFDAAVEKQRREGLAAGVESTPTLFIDGRPNVLPVKAWYLQFTIDDELQWKKEGGWKFGNAPQGRTANKGK